MERKNLEAGKKAAEKLAPNPVEHTPEAPIISEEEARHIESPDGQGANATQEASASAGITDDKVLGKEDTTLPEDGNVRIYPRHKG